MPGPAQGADNNHQVPQPYTIVLAANGSNMTADFGYTDIPPAAIGDLVWYDTDQDGFEDVGEPGIANVQVKLYRDNGTTPGLIDGSDTLVGTETTGADGGYIFTGLTPGHLHRGRGECDGAGGVRACGVEPEPGRPDGADHGGGGRVLRECGLRLLQAADAAGQRHHRRYRLV